MAAVGRVRHTRVALALLCLARLAAADGSTDSSVPSFARFKPRVDDLEHKEEGTFVSGLPLVGYDTNIGLGLGLGGYLTMDGKRSDPLFPVTPYRNRVFVQGYATTGGYQQHMITFDGLYIGDSPYRIRAALIYQRNTNANYFGVGSDSMKPLSYRGITHASYDDQTAAASQLGLDGTASPNYNHYEYVNPVASVTLERDFWGGRIRALYGFLAQYDGITKYDGQPTQGIESNGQSIAAIHGPTKLGLDCRAGRVTGCDGGFDNLIKAGIALDTRDFEPDPTKGFFIDATSEWSSRAFGSATDYIRFTAAARAYWSPFPKLTNLVLAVRLLYSMQAGNVPFFAMDTLALTEGDQNGLGGERTIRGYRQDRFIGPVAALANVELRWTFTHFKLFEQRFSLQVAPLFDIGRVFDNVEVDFTNWKPSGGAALRIAWNRSTVIMFDFGASSEDTGFYIDFGMPF
jgi:Omp85 superfamily domain